MAETVDDGVTQILASFAGSHRNDAVARLLPLVYDELRALADAQLQQERVGHTLQPTALVHEVYLRLANRRDVSWQDRSHFMVVAARTMRWILINHAKKHRAAKRGAGRSPLPIDLEDVPAPEQPVDLIALDDALNKLACQDEQKARIVELRYFGGCTIEETAQTLSIGTATVERDWRFARAWLRAELGAA